MPISELMHYYEIMEEMMEEMKEEMDNATSKMKSSANQFRFRR